MDSHYKPLNIKAHLNFHAFNSQQLTKHSNNKLKCLYTLTEITKIGIVRTKLSLR